MIHSLSQKARRARERSIVAFFATSLAQRGIGVFCQFAQVPIALHYLGSEGFGLWVTLMTLNFVVSSSDLGIGFGVQNRIAEALGAGDCDGARKVFVTGLCFLLGMMVVLLAVLIPFCLLSDIPRMFRISDLGLSGSMPASLLWVAIIWCLNVPLGLGQRLAYASQVGWMNNIASSANQLLTLALVSAAAWLKVGVITFFVISFGSGALISFFFLLYLLRHLGWSNLRLAEFRGSLLRDISGLGILFFIQQLAVIVMFSSPALILSLAMGPAAVTSYSLVQRVLNVFVMVATAILLPLWPAYADAKARSDWLWIRHAMLRSLLLVCGLSILPMLALGPFAQTFISWWTAGAASTTKSLIWLLIAWNALVLFQQPFGYLLAGLSEIKRATVYSLLSAGASLVMILFLIPDFGVNAVPIGLIVGFAPFVMAGTFFESTRLLFSPGRQRGALPQREPVPSV